MPCSGMETGAAPLADVARDAANRIATPIRPLLMGATYTESSGCRAYQGVSHWPTSCIRGRSRVFGQPCFPCGDAATRGRSRLPSFERRTQGRRQWDVPDPAIETAGLEILL